MVNFFKTLGIIVLGILSPISYAFVLVGLFIIIDTILAMLVKYTYAKKNNLPNPLTSKKFGGVIIKSIIYNLALLSGLFIDLFFIDFITELVPLSIDYLVTKVLLILMLFRESMSIDESVRYINDNKGFKYYLTEAFKHIKYFKDEVIKLFKN